MSGIASPTTRQDCTASNIREKGQIVFRQIFEIGNEHTRVEIDRNLHVVFLKDVFLDEASQSLC